MEIFKIFVFHGDVVVLEAFVGGPWGGRQCVVGHGVSRICSSGQSLGDLAWMNQRFRR